MKQAIYGLILFTFLALPPVANLLESIMIMHMHMQMPLLVFAGFLIARFFQLKFPQFFERWNANGVPGMLLFLIIWLYWMVPRAMDEALTSPFMELFKFFSLTFLAGIALRDSWKKLGNIEFSIMYIFFTLKFIIMGYLYLAIEDQICNNYLIIEQKTLGWGSLAMAVCFVIFGFYWHFTDQSEYQKVDL
ncbi:hypothetical protein NC661_13105 [Aquibacillus koreensis]|uniref:Uncharacterized protein n=1 Tax=Aquibacillus koreensis TaxID=279446 RepID=A0A9X3WMF6_9BACI|nr:hypothetical protein [Aquibacillus koreensis]MCT2536341.1 hypothetical protein [Aquibacillus koreensis]MDC3421308.1 hypothetical protein [Aquibacillus koreensis]